MIHKTHHDSGQSGSESMDENHLFDPGLAGGILASAWKEWARPRHHHGSSINPAYSFLRNHRDSLPPWSENIPKSHPVLNSTYLIHATSRARPTVIFSSYRYPFPHSRPPPPPPPPRNPFFVPSFLPCLPCPFASFHRQLRISLLSQAAPSSQSSPRCPHHPLHAPIGLSFLACLLASFLPSLPARP